MLGLISTCHTCVKDPHVFFYNCIISFDDLLQLKQYQGVIHSMLGKGSQKIKTTMSGTAYSLWRSQEGPRARGKTQESPVGSMPFKNHMQS